MPTTTTNYGFNKPLVADAIDEDLWGGYLNDNFDSIDTELKATDDATYSNVSAKTANYTVVAADRNSTISVDATSGAITISLTAAATLGDGFEVTVKKTDTSTNAVTIDANASETIDGLTTCLLSGENYTVVLVCDGTSWKIKSAYAPDATTSNIYLQSSVSTTSGTAFDTALPTGWKRLTVKFIGNSLSGTDSILVQIGSSGTPDTSGYVASSTAANSSGTFMVSSSSGFIIRGGLASYVFYGEMVISKADTNKYISTHSVTDSANTITGQGYKATSAEADIIRITRGGSNSFDAGSFSIAWEF